MEITAKMVNDLRQRTGAGMMECKAALKEAGGDAEEAVTILRKKGLAAAAKKAGRAATEGLVSAKVHPAAAVLLEVNCETDFVAKTEDFRTFVEKLSDRIAGHEAFGETSDGPVEALLRLPSPIALGTTVAEAVSQLIAKIGENMSVRRFARWIGKPGETFATYVHGNGRIGVIVGIPGAGGDLARDVAMHVAAAEPRFARREDVDAAALESEREIARAQAVASGKPANVVEKIAEGKIEKFYQECVLCEQAYVRDDKQTVGQVLKARGGEGALGLRFLRYKLGEGLARRENDFAAEVAAQSR
ncbi:MAG TPA: translation elongation factor Ts [Thermoanaerobaculia bacterium]|nr:translation elongation factor Ts [Thermoanaerobaculia bacterium]